MDISEISRLSIGHFLRVAVFTTFCHRKVAPKVSAGRKAAGNSQRLAKTGACRGLRHEVSFRLWRLGKVNFALTCRSSFASKPAPFFNARRCSFLFPHFSQCGDCCALRATMILISFYSVLAGLRPAGSHCENSGSSDGTGASARSGCANQRSLLCPLSERGYRHPLLFAVLDLLVLLDQAKSTEERKCTTEEIDSSEKIPTPRSAASYLRVGACGGSPLGACSAVLRR